MKKTANRRMMTLTGILVLLICAALTGCGQEEPVDVKKTADQVYEAISFEDSLTLTNDAMAQMLYGYEAADVKQAYVYISAGATTEEIAAFECTDAEAASRVYQAAQQRIENQKQSVMSYKPEELNRLDAAELRQKQSCVILVISSVEQTADVQKILNDSIGS